MQISIPSQSIVNSNSSVYNPYCLKRSYNNGDTGFHEAIIIEKLVGRIGIILGISTEFYYRQVDYVVLVGKVQYSILEYHLTPA